MMPEKLYIPTSTLNFNNLMSSESISPASFYLRRGFGYKRFEKVGPNPLDNRIILYREFPVFEIHDNELENYPMVIEIDSRNVNEDIIKENNGIYFAEETIYFNPFTTKFIFRNKQERTSTISKSEPSIETKMVPIYNNSFIIQDEYKDLITFTWEKLEIEDSKDDISPYISKDRRINKLKGFLYAYLIALNKSLSPDIVTLKKLARTLKNTLSAVITSPDCRATYSQEEQLKTLYKSINERLKKIYILPVIKEKSEKYQCDFYSLLTQEKLWESWLTQNNLSKYQIQPFYTTSKEKDVRFNNYIQNLDMLIHSVENQQKKLKANITDLPIIKNNKIVNIPEQKEFLTKLFNKYLEEAYNSDEFIQSRYEFAKSGGKVFKDELQEQWNGSQWQQYINGLLKNLNEFSAFDLKSINNITVESFAAFCQKGESDIDKLEDYLIINEIGDFRIAFSLWGIVFGFADMPKTLTNELFQSNDLKYITHIYKHIFKQMHSIELEGNLEKSDIKEQPDVAKPEKPQPVMPKEDDKTTSLKQDTQDIRRKLKDCKLKPEQLEKICTLWEQNNKSINDKLFKEIKEKVTGVGDAKVKKIKEAIGFKDDDKSKIKSSKAEQAPMNIPFEKNPIGKEFYNDRVVWEYIEELLPKDKKIQKQVKTDLTWFQENYNEKYEDVKKGSTLGNFFQNPKDNYSTINHFEKYLKKKLNVNQPWLTKIYEKVDIPRIISKLKELYLHEQ